MSSDPEGSPAPQPSPPAEQPVNAPAAESATPANARPAPSPPKIKIGTQRPGSERVFAKPQEPIYRRPAPSTAVSSKPAQPAPLPEQAESEVARQAESPPHDEGQRPAESQPAAGPSDEPDFPAPKIKVGSQRPGSPTVRAKPQIPGPPPEEPQRKRFPPPNKRHELSPELEVELAEAMGGMSLDEIVSGESTAAPKTEIEPDSRHQARVVKIHREDVFVDFGERNQGMLPLRQFPQPPEPGTVIDVIVSGFDPEEGLYQLTLPGAGLAVGDWSDVREGVLVEARVTGHNKGGLECDVNNLRGFIPAGQVSIYRIEDLSTLVGERFLCLVTEANPERRNLVLSRRAVLEREAAEAKEKLMQELAPGQVREGVVRNLRDFGAFVDLGGVDGLLHVSQLSWARVKHPSEVLQLGQKVTVKIQKIDPETGKISLAMKELTESPWTNIEQKYPVRSRVEGTVSKIMDFGAFVQLEPGVEGLVHISELAHQRVWRVSDVVSEGQTVEALVTSVDPEKQRIGLSMKAIMAKPMPVKQEQAEPEAEEPPPTPSKPRKTPLKGGLGRGSGGDQFGLNW
jgi:small subunit ribosomal protein S1